MTKDEQKLEKDHKYQKWEYTKVYCTELPISFNEKNEQIQYDHGQHKPKTTFVCQECGYSSKSWVGKCPKCDKWNTYKELNINKIEEYKKVENPYALDPELPFPNKVENLVWQLAWSEKNKYWTSIETYLNELGDKGWEVVTVTPPWSSVTPINVGIGSSYERHPFHHYFHILLKRPKSEM